ncbi:formylglycine-generating enzyme family protein [Mastigocoleus sp. MO_188.B34]|uniref:formylglycine-generating enzyme family protein n=1 Tax=Mastigocoleus sp. MO_188.B34 TaxID=3036635 RepID=UPI0026022533|nr:formylglycine-generating enzyme family protein [Mastigocoleus sp. MO_188.B34]MDJ0695214.1 formylglycine-generating enzyme family protein [Mastigocoleus sp. MO_188.B34]
MKQVTGSEGIGKLWTVLKQAQLELDAEEIADLLWLAVQMGEVEKISASDSTPEESAEETETKIIKTEIEETTALPPTSTPANPESLQQPAASVNIPSASNGSDDKTQSQSASESIPFKAPAAPALRNKLALGRALRPLMRKVSSRTRKILDAEETVTQFAENRILLPKFKPEPERWLDLALVVEKSPSIIIWREIIAEFQQLIEFSGAFRSVFTWSLQTDDKGEIKLFSQQNQSTHQQSPRSPQELLDSAGRRLILFVSDCTSQIWYQGKNQNKIHQTLKIHDILKKWSNSGCLAIVQLFPEWLWTRTAMGFGYPVLLNALEPGVPNKKLTVEGLPVWEDVDVNQSITLPIITLDPDSVKQWSRVVAGFGSTQTAGILFDPNLLQENLIPEKSEISNNTNNEPSAADLVNRFRATASPTARRLAGLMATVPVSLPVVHLIQQTILKESMQVHVAEVFMSGLLKRDKATNTANYDFVEVEGVGVRDLLTESVPTPDVDQVLHEVSQYIAKKAGISIKNFAALLSPDPEWDDETKEKIKQDTSIQSFAKITTDVLKRLGGEYAEFAEYLKEKSQKSGTFPPLEDFNFEIAKIVIEDDEIKDKPELAVDIQPFEFEVATIELKKTGFFRRNTELIIKRRRQQAYGFSENLGDGTVLEMVEIPTGTFKMGAPETEESSRDSERPQHEVTVPTFFMGKYQVTQVQWKFVASLPQVNRELKPDPSDFKGDNRPVESVDWSDAVEFCDRLSEYTKRNYRLPSEAEWEYACRAGTTTPFHFGETITSELANYNAEYTYGAGTKGTYRQETTEVGSFGVANGFGLYDMHGNVWEWCEDTWHNNYEGAPTDGRAWVEAESSDNDNRSRRLLRGGSWYYNPQICRCAFRFSYVIDYILVGLRVVCGVSP